MIDLQAAYDTFENGTDFTVGIEEEFAILDPETLNLVSKFEILQAAAAADPVLEHSLAGELIASEVEIRSGRGDNFDHALEAQYRCREYLFRLAHENDLLLGATATHPFALYQDQRFIDTPHYRLVTEELQYVAWRNNTFSVHVHVGVKGAQRAVLVCDRLRNFLPWILALSANSPFVDGRDSGLHSARTQTFTRTFPRCGIPDAFGSWAEWSKYVELLDQTDSILEFTQIWWSIRPHHRFGTVEVRIADAQMTAGESDNLARLITACVVQAAQDVDAGVSPDPLPNRFIEENMWRAIRRGKDARLIDFEGDGVTQFPANEIVDRLAEWTGVKVDLPELNGAQRQRVMIADGASPQEVYDHCVKETQATYFSNDGVA